MFDPSLPHFLPKNIRTNVNCKLRARGGGRRLKKRVMCLLPRHPMQYFLEAMGTDEVHITGDGLQTRSGIFRIESTEQVIFSVFKHVNGPCLGGVP